MSLTKSRSPIQKFNIRLWEAVRYLVFFLSFYVAVHFLIDWFSFKSSSSSEKVNSIGWSRVTSCTAMGTSSYTYIASSTGWTKSSVKVKEKKLPTIRKNSRILGLSIWIEQNYVLVTEALFKQFVFNSRIINTSYQRSREGEWILLNGSKDYARTKL